MDGSQAFAPDVVETRSSALEIAGAGFRQMTPCTMAGIPIPLWRLRPAGNPKDPRWQGRAIHADTIVRAPSAAMARVIASRLDRRPDAVRRGNESLCFRSGFEDEKLYWVSRIDEAEATILRPGGGAEARRCEALVAA